MNTLTPFPETSVHSEFELGLAEFIYDERRVLRRTECRHICDAYDVPYQPAHTKTRMMVALGQAYEDGKIKSKKKAGPKQPLKAERDKRISEREEYMDLRAEAEGYGLDPKRGMSLPHLRRLVGAARTRSAD